MFTSIIRPAKKPKYAVPLNKEKPISYYIPYSSHITNNTLVTKNGSFIKIWKVAGISFETADIQTLGIYKNQLNQLYKQIGTPEIDIWVNLVRSETKDKLNGVYSDSFSEHVNNKYNASFDEYGMRKNELYFSLVYTPPKNTIQKADKALDRFFKAFSRKKKESSQARKVRLDILKENLQIELHKNLKEVNRLGKLVESRMKDYGINRVEGIEPLEEYIDEKGVQCSSALEFLNFLLTGRWQKVRTTNKPLDLYLGNSQVLIGTEVIVLKSVTKTLYAQAIDLKDYPEWTEPGMINNLMREDFDFVVTQSFSPIPKWEALELMERTQKQLASTEDAAIKQIDALDKAREDLVNGDFVFGKYHFSLMIYAENIQDLQEHISKATTKLENSGFTPAPVNIATDATFYAQLPANKEYRPRIASLTSRNFAGLCSFHNFKTGKRDHNPWGEAVTILKTDSGQPFYFNFHFAKPEADDVGKKRSGNTFLIGTTGSGKTVLMTFLLSQLQKFKNTSEAGFSTVFLDKDRGAETYIRAIGGKYFTVHNGEPTGMNPLQLDPSPDNLEFLRQWLRVLVSANGEKVSVRDQELLNKALETVMFELPIEQRTLSILLQNIQEGKSVEEQDNSVYKRLANWCAFDSNANKGAYWWVFDACRDEQNEFIHNKDYLNFEAATNIGIDGTDFLENAMTRTPLSMYILHKMETVIDGRCFAYFMDEAWRWIDDPAFAEFAGNKQVTIRKQNGFGVFATQMPSQFLKSKIAAQLIQQCITQIYLPNPNAIKEEYVNGFGVSEREFEIIKNLSPADYKFLIKQDRNSYVVKLDLADFDDEMNVLSGTTENVHLLDEIFKERDFNETTPVTEWLPIFTNQIKERTARSKTRSAS